MMLVNLNRRLNRRPEPSGIVELLLACHDRIRAFVDLATRLGEAKGLPEEQIRDAAHRVRRYFDEALPLHVEDEEQSILPRLRGCDPQVDASLAQMQREHHAHEALVETLVSTCRELETAPSRHSELREKLFTTAAALNRELGAHLQQEEDVILPAIARWSPQEQQAAMIAELRDRRSLAETGTTPPIARLRPARPQSSSDC